MSKRKKINVFGVPVGREQQYTGFFALGCVVAYARCVNDGDFTERFKLTTIEPLLTEELQKDFCRQLQNSNSKSIVLLSAYVWNHDQVVNFARRVKAHNKDTLIIVGGPHIPRRENECNAYMCKYHCFDIVVRSEGEKTLAAILEKISGSRKKLRNIELEEVSGLTYRDKKMTPIRTPDREKTRDLSDFPSPYLTGEFDQWVGDLLVAPLETNRGCPFGCTFCDWGAATLSNVSKFSLERVKDEIEYLAKKKVPAIYIADANFGAFEEDVEISRHIVKINKKYGYPKRINYNSAKNAGRRLREVIHILAKANLIVAGQISLQTTDQHTLEVIERSNIKTEKLEKLLEYFNEEDIPVTAELMVGLPGQSIQSLKNDLQHCINKKLCAHVHVTSSMPNAPLSDPDYVKKHNITTDEYNFVISTDTFSKEDYQFMIRLVQAYNFFIKQGVLKYFLYWLQVEHGIKAMNFLEAWLRASTSSDKYPIAKRICKSILIYNEEKRDWLNLAWGHQARFLFNNLPDFHNEILKLINDTFGILPSGSGLDAILGLQECVMPRVTRTIQTYNNTYHFPHDVLSYLAQLNEEVDLSSPQNPIKSLEEYPPGNVEVYGEEVRKTYKFVDIQGYMGSWELDSNIQFSYKTTDL